MKVAIVGTGPIGLGYAALLLSRGHEPALFSTRRSLPGDDYTIVTDGLLVTEFSAPVLSDPTELERFPVVILCTRGDGQKAALDALAEHLARVPYVIFSSQGSLSALYLSQLLAEVDQPPVIGALATTVSAGPLLDGVVHIQALRSELDVASLPVSALPEVLNLLSKLFGDRFVPSDNVLAITLSNLNPQIHMANGLLNFTRMERAEVWTNYGGITESAGRLIESLDEERLRIASALGVKVRTVREHYLKTFDSLVPGTIHEMAKVVDARRGHTAPGPRTIRSSYFSEDLPFGILPTIALAEVAGVQAPLHVAGLDILSAACGHDFRSDNDLLPAIGLKKMSPQDLRLQVTNGWCRAD